MLGLRKGDMLVVALSEGNAKNGGVSPEEIRRLLDRGVEVFVDERLHAKIYLFGGVLAVGSPNLSRHSEAALHEVLLLSRERRIVRQARRWFDDMRSTPVTPEWLDYCSAVYKPPRLAGTTRARAAREGRSWLVGVRESEFPADEEDWRIAVEGQAESKVSAGYDVETLRFPETSVFAREVKPGDLVTQVWRDADSHRVYPQARVLEVSRRRNRRGVRVIYIYVESSTNPKSVSFSKFSRGMAQVGLRLGRDVSARELTGEQVIARARSLTRQLPP